MPENYLHAAIEIAQEAGKILVEELSRPLDIAYKGEEVDIVTQADKRSERLIVERLTKYFPEHAIAAEEGTGHESSSASEFRWHVDPLDGTTNYAHGYPCFCVSIGLEHKGELVVGVVYDPILDEMFAAERGGGATLNGRRIHVSEVEDLNRALLCTGFPYDVRERNDFARHFVNFIMHAQGV